MYLFWSIKIFVIILQAFSNIVMNRIFLFLKRCFITLSASSQGRYSERTNDVNELRREMLEGGFGSFRTDKDNLIRDKKAVSRDVRRAFSHISN